MRDDREFSTFNLFIMQQFMLRQSFADFQFVRVDLSHIRVTYPCHAGVLIYFNLSTYMRTLLHLPLAQQFYSNSRGCPDMDYVRAEHGTDITQKNLR